MRDRVFDFIKVIDDGRPSSGLQIVCAECGETSLFKQAGERRRPPTAASQYFRNHGWAVAKTRSGDLCPACIEAKRKVVKMSDHKRPEQPEQQRSMSRDDGRVLSRAIEDHWDETGVCYQPGWSDVRMAEEMGTPLEWVKAIRERDFGGVGEDPGLLAFMAEQASIRVALTDLTSQLEQTTKALAASAAWAREALARMDEDERKLDGYRKAHNRLFERVTKLGEAADALHLPRKAG